MLIVRDYLEYALTESVDLKAVIMFLIFEKKVITLEDDSEKLAFYLQPKYQKKMNEHIRNYKPKMGMPYEPRAFSCQTTEGTMYVKAYTDEQAFTFLHERGYSIQTVRVTENDLLMHQIERNKITMEATISEMLEQKKQIPSLLGEAT